MISPPILEALDRATVRCCLIGAQALALRGVARYTAAEIERRLRSP